MTTKQKGNLTELQCLASFVELGYNVSIPYGEDSKYDFIADINGILIKVQVKTSSLKNNTTDAIVFSCRSTHKNSNGASNIRYTKNEIDYFATYWKNKCYLVPVEETSTEKTLRFAPPKNNCPNINYAKDYELEIQLSKFLEGGSN